MLTKLFSLLLALLSLGQATLENYSEQMDMGGLLFLVNRQYTIGADYAPNDLVAPNVKKTSSATKLRKVAAEALEMMFAGAKEAGFTLYAVSGYRSYDKQTRIYNNKIKAVGSVEKANLTVAPPGASEHQLGLAMDIGLAVKGNLTNGFGKTKAGKWAAEHCYEYGFILRYKEEWTAITGYAYEPWHFRYVGVEHALRIKEADVPLETYIEQLQQALFTSVAEGAV